MLVMVQLAVFRTGEVVNRIKETMKIVLCWLVETLETVETINGARE